MTFEIIAYPAGDRTWAGTVHGRGVEDAIPYASTQARLRGEYVDVEQDGRRVAVCDGAGPTYGYGEFRRA